MKINYIILDFEELKKFFVWRILKSVCIDSKFINSRMVYRFKIHSSNVTLMISPFHANF